MVDFFEFDFFVGRIIRKVLAFFLKWGVRWRIRSGWVEEVKEITDM